MYKEWENYMGEHGIKHHTTRCATPQQNGVAERFNRTFDELLRYLRTLISLPSSGVRPFIHVVNLTPTSTLADMPPFEAFLRVKPSVDHLRVFGCQAYVHVQRDKRKGLQQKSEHCIFIGHPLEYRGWSAIIR